MLTQSLSLAFEIPDGWNAFRDGGRFVYQGPRREELIVSGTVVTGSGDPEQRKALIEDLVSNAKRAAAVGASHPDTRVTVALQAVELEAPLACWVLHAEAVDEPILFSQAIVQHANGAALITFEAPLDSESRELFWRLLISLHEPPFAATGV